MPRVSILEPNRVVSFFLEPDDLACAVAACCADPTSFNEFLAAFEAFRSGNTRRVIDGLMDFDAALRRLGPDRVRQALISDTPLEDLGAITVFEAGEPDLIKVATTGDVLVVDLGKKSLTALTSAAAVARSGSVDVVGGSATTGQTVTYELPKSWTIHFPA